MNPIRSHGIRIGVLAFFAVLGMSFLAVDQAQAQSPGGMTRGGGGKGGGKAKPDRPSAPKDDVQWTDTGSDRCKILDFQALKEGGDADVLGILRIRPLPKKARTLKLQVRKAEDPIQILLQGSTGTLDLDILSTIPLKNVLCEASWGAALRDPASDSDGKDKKKSGGEKARELRSLTLETLAVEGKIESIEGDIVTIKAKPANGAQWPDVDLKQKDQPEKKANAKAPVIAQRKLKLKLIDDVSKFEAGNNEPLEVGDFKVEQEVEAVVVFGSKTGLLVTLRAPGVEGKKNTAEPKPPPTPPPGDRGGRREPRGGGRRGPGI